MVFIETNILNDIFQIWLNVKFNIKNLIHLRFDFALYIFCDVQRRIIQKIFYTYNSLHVIRYLTIKRNVQFL